MDDKKYDESEEEFFPSEYIPEAKEIPAEQELPALTKKEIMHSDEDDEHSGIESKEALEELRREIVRAELEKQNTPEAREARERMLQLLSDEKAQYGTDDSERLAKNSMNMLRQFRRERNNSGMFLAGIVLGLAGAFLAQSIFSSDTFSGELYYGIIAVCAGIFTLLTFFALERFAEMKRSVKKLEAMRKGFIKGMHLRGTMGLHRS